MIYKENFSKLSMYALQYIIRYKILLQCNEMLGSSGIVKHIASKYRKFGKQNRGLPLV